MRLALAIALRYLFSRKQHNAVNVISLISVAGIAVASMAMIVVLSVFNGFTDLAQRQLSRIDPPIAVTPVAGKVISDADSVIGAIKRAIPASRSIPVITEQALAMSDQKQMAVRILGVPDDFVTLSSLDSITIDGDAIVTDSPWHLAMSSVGVALGLNRRPGDLSFIELYVPRRRGRISTANPATAFRNDTIVMAGVYQVEQENYDNDMLIVPLSVARDLLDYTTEATSVYVYPDMQVTENMQRKLSKELGDSFDVKNRLQQQSESFKMISVEKWITFLMLSFILVIASFNIISTMAMLIIEKEGNMAILKAMGATNAMINTIFVIQGWLISIIGGIFGIIIGLVLCLVQQWGGLIRLNTSNPSALSIDVYPVLVSPSDILIVAAVIVAVGFVTGLAAARK